MSGEWAQPTVPLLLDVVAGALFFDSGKKGITSRKSSIGRRLMGSLAGAAHLLNLNTGDQR